jgi:hypothetical protein
MKAIEFESQLTPDARLMVPEFVANQLVPGHTVRVLVLVEEEDVEERDWKRMGAEAFLRGYDEGDAIYDDLQVQSSQCGGAAEGGKSCKFP